MSTSADRRHDKKAVFHGIRYDWQSALVTVIDQQVYTYVSIVMQTVAHQGQSLGRMTFALAASVSLRLDS